MNKVSAMLNSEVEDQHIGFEKIPVTPKPPALISYNMVHKLECKEKRQISVSPSEL